jgi:hypothetical protein
MRPLPPAGVFKVIYFDDNVLGYLHIAKIAKIIEEAT